MCSGALHLCSRGAELKNAASAGRRAENWFADGAQAELSKAVTTFSRFFDGLLGELTQNLYVDIKKLSFQSRKNFRYRSEISII